MQEEKMPNFIKAAIGFIVLVIVSIIISIACLDRINAAHVGIRVRLAGNDRGVQDIPVVTGWVFYNPLTEQVFEFPTSIQNIVWSKSAHEGKPVDESITFSSSEGIVVNCDIGIAFRIDPKKAPEIYLKFKQNDLEILANTYIRNSVRESFTVTGSKYPIQDIYGANKGKLVHEVLTDLNNKLIPMGIIIDQLTINGAPRLPENVTTAINMTIQATQKAIEAENKVRQVKAEAEQAVAAANGAADSKRVEAKGDADAMLIRAKAEAKSNMIIRMSINGTMLHYNSINKWNGKLPAFIGSGGNLPMLTFDTSSMAGNSDKKLEELLAEDDKK